MTTNVISFFSTKKDINNRYNACGDFMNNLDLVVQDNSSDLLSIKKLTTAIYKLTHELKNPLSVCNGYLEMISNCDDGKKDKYLSIITEEIKRSIHIINDYSALGKIKELKKEYFDYSCLMEDVYNTLGDYFKKEKAKIIYNYQKEHIIYGDYQKIKQVVINILKNALESKNKDCLWIKVVVKEYKNKIVISFQDNGKGISSEEILKIRTEFYTTKKNGTGLGIPFCEEIMQLHSGSLQIASRVDVGSVISLIFPK